MTSFLESPIIEIPDFVSISGWKQVSIEECYQPLINLDNLHSKIQVDPKYYLKGIPNSFFDMYLRQEAAEKLVDAAELLPKTYSLIVFDAFRPLAVQTSLFDSFKEQVRLQYPEKNEEEIVEYTQIYVSLPSEDPLRPSPHATGGSVDLSILGSDGLPLDMGTEFDSFEIQARTDYFKNDQNTAHRNRCLLYTVMTRAGFTNYTEEWWHYDLGNQFWGKINEQKAIYGLANMEELNGCNLGTMPKNVDSVFYRLRANGSLERFVKVGLAGAKDDLVITLEELSKLENPYFTIKQQLAWIIARKHNVYRFAI